MKNITLISLFNLAIKHILLIITTAAVFAGAAFAYCEFIATPRYSAKGAILVTNGAITTDESGAQTTIANTDIAASINISDTVTDTLSTNGIYKQLSENINNQYSYVSLKSRASISQRDNNSLFIDISFTAEKPEEAVKLVNSYLDIAPEYISEALPGTASSVYGADSAAKVFPNTFTVTVIAGLLGALAAYVVVFIIDSLDTVIHDEDDFKERFDVPVIGSVPDFSAARSGKSYKGYNAYGYNSYGYASAEKGETKNGK